MRSTGEPGASSVTDGPFGGRRYLIDKSAAARSGDPRVSAEWTAATRARQLVVCSVFLIAALYSARDAAHFEAIEEDLGVLPQVRIHSSTWRAALGAVRDLAAEGPGRHRVSFADTLIAAAAQENTLGVIHYDEHYDRLAAVLNFESRWLAPRGSL
jgi:predicted nucleic acid-binding protein